MKNKEPVVGIEPTADALRKHCSTAELHRLSDCYKRIVNTLVLYLTLAIIPFVYSPCQAFLHPAEPLRLPRNHFQIAVGPDKTRGASKPNLVRYDL